VQHFTQRGVAAQKGIGLRRHRGFDAFQQRHTRFIQEREEQGLLAWKMKVEPTLGRIRGARDLVDRGVAIAVLGEDLECGVEHALSPRSTSFLDARHRSPAAKTDRLVGRIF
jgi:hypothetical protein